ncbi:hypothetical protein C8J57DRAFT_947103, partial [Mycena rebaudengoi]
ILDPSCQLLKSVIAALNERVARIQFQKVTHNEAQFLTDEAFHLVELDTQVDVMFENPGMLLCRGSQRYFTKIIKSLRTRPYRKNTFTNLDRIRCSVEEVSGHTASDETIWKSVRSVTLQCLTREFYWKCIHNTFKVGDYWSHINTLESRGRCSVCDVTETLEHIALECEVPGQKIIWNLTR